MAANPPPPVVLPLKIDVATDVKPQFVGGPPNPRATIKTYSAASKIEYVMIVWPQQQQGLAMVDGPAPSIVVPGKPTVVVNGGWEFVFEGKTLVAHGGQNGVTLPAVIALYE